MPVKFPDYLVAIDKKRRRVFVLKEPSLMAVKRSGVWYYGEQITDEEVEKYYELVVDLERARMIIEEAKTELNIP